MFFIGLWEHNEMSKGQNDNVGKKMGAENGKESNSAGAIKTFHYITIDL